MVLWHGVNRTHTRTACTHAHSVSQHILNRLTTFHHANTRGSRAGRLGIAHLCVPKQLSSTCHVSFLAASWHWPQAQALSHLPHLSIRQSHQHAQDLWYTIHIYLRSSTAEWRNTNPISDRLWAQIDWDQIDRDHGDRAWRPRAQQNWAC